MGYKTRKYRQRKTKNKFRKTHRYGGANAVAAAKAFKKAKCAPKANKNKELQKYLQLINIKYQNKKQAVDILNLI